MAANGQKTALSIAGPVIIILIGIISTAFGYIRANDVDKVNLHIEEAGKHFDKSADDFRADTLAIHNNTVKIVVLDSEVSDMKEDLSTVRNSQMRMQDDVQNIVIQITRIGSTLETMRP